MSNSQSREPGTVSRDRFIFIPNKMANDGFTNTLSGCEASPKPNNTLCLIIVIVIFYSFKERKIHLIISQQIRKIKTKDCHFILKKYNENNLCNNAHITLFLYCVSGY